MRRNCRSRLTRFSPGACSAAGVQQQSTRLGKNASTATGSFFASLNPIDGLFDPKVIYDQYNSRFVVVALEQESEPTDSRSLVAVSDDSDPNGTWYFTAINSKVKVGNTNYWADYPGLAIDSQAIYITGNLFTFNGNGSNGSRLWIIPKTPFYSGGSASATIYNPGSL